MNHKLIKSLEILNHSNLPDKLLFRDKEYTQLLANMKSSINTLIYGPSGSGKTSLLKRICAECNSNTVKAIYIDCLLYETANAVFREILIDRPIASRSNYDLLKRLMERAKNSKFTIFLDHIENLKEKQIISQLLQSGVCLIIASTGAEFIHTVSPKSNLSISTLIGLKPYSEEEMFQIIKSKTEQCLTNNLCSDGIMRQIIEKTKGDTNLALNVLKAAIIKANNEGKDSIDEINLESILLEHDCPQKLNADERLLLTILQEWKTLPASRLHDFYLQKSKHPKSERAFRNYMENLCSKGLVKAIGEKRGRVYELVEETNN